MTLTLPERAYELPGDRVAESLGVTRLDGLAPAQAAARLAASGPNRLAEPAPRRLWQRFADQFRSLLILVLVAAAVLAGIVGEIKDAVVIGIVLLVNATIGVIQEGRAERSLEALRSMLVPTARVRRAGAVAVVPAADLVPGDVVLLEAGDKVPADARLLVAEGVEVDESALTGESVAVGKSPDVVGDGATGPVPVAERTGMVFMNTTLTRGRAEAVVTATGMATVVGGIAELLRSGEEPQTPLQRELDSLGKRLALLGATAVTLYTGLALLRGEALSDLALRAVALAVATIPEGLPAVLALTLALGVHRMARRSAIVRRLAAVETLGSATVICSDKTGTLTVNRMTVTALRTLGPAVPLARDPGLTTCTDPLVVFALCNDAVLTDEGPVGDPTETALLVAARESGHDVQRLRAAAPRTAELPFDSARKYMATAHRDSGAAEQVHVKGAADVLLRLCDAVASATGPRPLDATERERVAALIDELAGQGLRVLAAATGRRHGGGPLDPSRLPPLTLLGLAGLADPPRPEARDAVALCHRAGIAVKMITGDHAATAAAVARQVGIRGDVVTGTDLDRIDEEELARRVEGIGVFARVAPEHKVAIVAALRARGHVAAMTGDGVNDAAALRSAHIGVAMGRTGTEVTKEAADMVLADDNFATIVGAVREGRAIYDNVVKFVRFQLSTNIAAILAFLGASLAGYPPPLSAIQVLWVNIIMDGPPAMALGVDPARPGLMHEPPRDPAARILSGRRLARMLRAGSVMAAGTLAVLATARAAHGAEVAATMAFTTFVLFQFFNALNARAEGGTVFTRHLFANRALWVSLLVVLVLQVLVVQVAPLQGVFGTVPLSAAQWALCASVASTVLLVEEAVKALRRHGAAGR